MKKHFPALMTLCALALCATSAFAHPGHIPTGGFLYGAEHPLSGIDHILAMLAVGLWAAQLANLHSDKRTLWKIPAAFVSMMAIGGVLGMSHLVLLPSVEVGIGASVLILGILIAAAVELPLPVSATIVGCFAILHGFAHGAEMPETVSTLSYSAGFILATITLHATGIGIGLLTHRGISPKLVRFSGVAIALAGIILLAG
jgi:urease accessory protein